MRLSSDSSSPFGNAKEALTMKWDVFISHASEDKEEAARPLANALIARGLRVWLDEAELKLGDSLQQRIDDGLSQSRFGVVILSNTFFSKHWTRKELDGLAAKEEPGRNAILPVRHNITLEEIRKHSPSLAGRLSIGGDKGWDVVAREVLRAIGPSIRTSKFKTINQRKAPCYCVAFIEIELSKEYSMSHIQCVKGSKKNVRAAEMVDFAQRLLVPTISCTEILTGSALGTVRRGRLIECNPTYGGFENSYCFMAPIQGLTMKYTEWNSLNVEIQVRDREARGVDFGFLDVVIEPMIVPVDQEGLYIPPVTGTPQEDKLLTLSAELSRPLGKIAAMCIGDDDGALIFEKPCWTDESLASGGGGYLLQGMLV